MTPAEVIAETRGRFFTVYFWKRSDNQTLRKMNCRTGVKKHLKGGTLGYDPASHNLVQVWERKSCKNGDTGYRMVSLENVVMIKSRKVVFTFGTNIEGTSEGSVT